MSRAAKSALVKVELTLDVDFIDEDRLLKPTVTFVQLHGLDITNRLTSAEMQTLVAACVEHCE